MRTLQAFAPLALASLLALAALPTHAQGVDTLAKIKESGVITMGVREAGGVLSYSPAVGEYVGYHIDICRRIVANVAAAVGRKVEIRYQQVTALNRSPLVANGTVHIECGVTTNNLSRQASVAFANTTYLETIRMLVKANSGIQSVADLGGKVVATTNGSTSVQLLRKNKRATDIQFNETFCKDHADCFLLVQSGRADAFVLDNSILATLRARARNPGDFKIVGEPLSTEPIAIMLPKGDAPFKKLADDTIAQLARSGELNKLYDKWFLQPTPPANVVLDLPMSAEMKALIAQPNDKPVEEYAQDR